MDPNPYESPQFIEPEVNKPAGKVDLDGPFFVVLSVAVVMASSFAALALQSAGSSGYEAIIFFAICSVGLVSAWCLCRLAER